MAPPARRRHGWLLPLHPLQVVAMVLFLLLMSAFYLFMGPFLGNRVVENTVITVFSFAVISVILLFIRCTATDPSDRTFIKKKRAAKKGQLLKLKYKFVLTQVIKRFLRKLDNRIHRCFIRRSYLVPTSRNSLQFHPFFPFPLVMLDDDAVSPHMKDEEFSYCSLCDLEVMRNSKHCRSCNRCVEGFDHHCRWLNNCIGKRNYTTFILLMVFVLLMLIIEGASAIAMVIRCLVDRRGVAFELHHKLHVKFPIGVPIGFLVIVALLSAYSLAALGQLFLFHVVLIRKGMRTYDYIIAMKEEREAMDQFEDLDSDSDSDGSIDSDSPQPQSLLSRFFCKDSHSDKGTTQRLSIRIDSSSNLPIAQKKTHFKINPWKLLKMSKEKALHAAEKARERIRNEKQVHSSDQTILKPLPLETKHGPLGITEKKINDSAVLTEMPPVVPRSWFLPGSPASSPRRRVSGSQQHKCRSSFDLKLITQASREMEFSISTQVSSLVLKEGAEAADI